MNGALIRAHDSVNLEIMISDTFLLPSQIVSEDSSMSYLQKAYYFAQQMLIEPQLRDEWRNKLDASLLRLSTDLEKRIQEATQVGDLQKVLGIIRQELKKVPVH
ncbi:hypothetical protein MEX01_51740 [Methylorubrum extorquens]|nr:hypothetical protein MEX01_51740 [Methylorubrum extorquens]